MKYSYKLSDAVHILVFVALGQDEPLTSAVIAESIRTNPSYVRRLMASCKAAGLIESTRGQAKPRLARPACEISLLDIYHAVEGDTALLHLDTHTNPECGMGVNIQNALRGYYDEVQAAAETQMANISLQNIVDTFHKMSETKDQSTFSLYSQVSEHFQYNK